MDDLEKLSFLRHLPGESKAEFIAFIQKAAREKIAVCIMAGGTPICYKDGVWALGRGVVEKKDGKKKVKKISEEGPSKTETQTLKWGVDLAEVLEKLGIPYFITVPIYDLKGVADSQTRKKLQKEAKEDPHRFLTANFRKIIGNKKIKILFSSGYSHATDNILKRFKKMLSRGELDEAKDRVRKFFWEVLSIMYNIYYSNHEFKDIFLSTPLSRESPREDFSAGLDAVDAMQSIGLIPIRFKGSNHCVLVNAGRRESVRRMMGKEFHTVNEDTPILTIDLCAALEDDPNVAKNGVRAIDLMTTLGGIDHHFLIVSHRNKVRRIFSSETSRKAIREFRKGIGILQRKVYVEIYSIVNGLQMGRAMGEGDIERVLASIDFEPRRTDLQSRIDEVKTMGTGGDIEKIKVKATKVKEIVEIIFMDRLGKILGELAEVDEELIIEEIRKSNESEMEDDSIPIEEKMILEDPTPRVRGSRGDKFLAKERKKQKDKEAIIQDGLSQIEKITRSGRIEGILETLEKTLRGSSNGNGCGGSCEI